MDSAKESLSVRTGARKERGWKREATTTQTIPLVWHFYSHLTHMFVFFVLPQSYLKKTKPAVHLRRTVHLYPVQTSVHVYSHSRMSETCSGIKYSALIVSIGIQFFFCVVSLHTLILVVSQRVVVMQHLNMLTLMFVILRITISLFYQKQIKPLGFVFSYYYFQLSTLMQEASVYLDSM